MEVDNGLSTYVIVIPNFRKKLREANVGEVVSTKKFMIQESMFTIDLYIAGDEINSWGHLSLFLTNESAWKVRAVTKVSVIVTNSEVRSVKRFLLFSDGPDGEIFQSKNADKPERSLGWAKCVPHSRCFISDFLSTDGALTLNVTVQVLAEFAEAQLSDSDDMKRFLLPSQDQEKSNGPTIQKYLEDLAIIKGVDQEPPASAANEEMGQDLSNQLAALEEATEMKFAVMEQNNQKQLEALEQGFQEKLLALEQRLASQTAELSDVKAKLLNVETGIIAANDNHKRAIIPEVESKNNSSQRIPFNILCFR